VRYRFGFLLSLTLPYISQRPLALLDLSPHLLGHRLFMFLPLLESW
jgi:hypothetical protein